jgi:hypothetical protein
MLCMIFACISSQMLFTTKLHMECYTDDYGSTDYKEFYLLRYHNM